MVPELVIFYMYFEGSNFHATIWLYNLSVHHEGLKTISIVCDIIISQAV